MNEEKRLKSTLHKFTITITNWLTDTDVSESHLTSDMFSRLTPLDTRKVV